LSPECTSIHSRERKVGAAFHYRLQRLKRVTTAHWIS